MRDTIEQLVRCYTMPVQKPRTGRLTPKPKNETRAPLIEKSDEERRLEEIARPWGGWGLVIACEPTAGCAPARVGAYALYGARREERIRRYRRGGRTRDELGMDRLAERGLWYDPDLLSPAEIAAIQSYAHAHDLGCMTRAAFVAKVLYHWAYQYGALVIGHGLAPALGALCRQWEVIDAGRYRNGFRLGFCDCDGRCHRCHEPRAVHPLAGCDMFICPDHPPLDVKHVGADQDKIRFHPPKHEAWRTGRFLDTVTLGGVVLGTGDTALRAMGKRAGAVLLAQDEELGPGQEIDERVLDSLTNRVAATWALYGQERDLYRLHGTGRDIWTLFSPGSLGKAILHEIGAPRRQYEKLPPEVLGYAMVALYAGRCEVGRRLVPTEVIYTDFRSQYPTVQGIMQLQDLWLAESFEVRGWPPASAEARRFTEQTRHWLQVVTLADLQNPDTWRRWLRRLVKIKPRGDVLPVRADYGPDEATTALAPVEDGPPTWYTLADAVISLLHMGKAPDVLEAIEIVPVGRVQTTPYMLLGNPRYTIDLKRGDNPFVRVVQARGDVKAERDRQPQGSPEWLHLDSLQQALKELAVSSSFGIFGQIIVEEPTDKPRALCVYGMDTKTITTHVVERPGEYFLAPVAAFITGGGRLLIALAERLAAIGLDDQEALACPLADLPQRLAARGRQWGIGSAYIDTDAIQFAKPDGMDRETFRQHVADVCAWFAPLSPYGDGKPLLEVEDENFAIGPDGTVQQGVLDPLFCIVVCDKRPVLYNRLPDGLRRIRKFSAHGIGTSQSRDGYVSPPHVPEPWTDVSSLANGVGERWQYDQWYAFITDVEAGQTQHRVVGQREPGWLDLPAFYHVAVTTAEIAGRYIDVPGLRPYGTVTVLPPLDRAPTGGDVRSLYASATAAMDGVTLASASFYAPYAGSVDELQGVRYVDRTGVSQLAPEGLPYVTVARRFDRYFVQRVHKSADPGGVGVLPRRHVRVGYLRGIGKESDRIAEEVADATDSALILRATQRFDATGLPAVLARYSIAQLRAVTGLPRQTLYDARRGVASTPAMLRRLRRGLTLLDNAPPEIFSGWQNIPALWLSERTHLPAVWIEEIRRGERDVPEDALHDLITAVRVWWQQERRQRPLTWREHRALRRAVRAAGGVARPKNPDGTCSWWPFSRRLQSEAGKDIKAVMRKTAAHHRCRTVAAFVELLVESSARD
jgi:hypothetical protein